MNFFVYVVESTGNLDKFSSYFFEREFTSYLSINKNTLHTYLHRVFKTKPIQ